ncbi:DUF1343 domain-containing protein, partial [bacterium]|nr:DUF1343 domain-containing protein [candidate division CSSED10-310 bacterium]
MSILTGIDVLLSEPPTWAREARLGLLYNQASVDTRLRSSPILLHEDSRFHLTTLFGPQHGISGHQQDNMIEWEGRTDPRTGLPIFSLYGKRRKPNAAMLDDIDVLLIDLQDVGARYYTFTWTMYNCMEACREQGKICAILDRPNPIGGISIEGNLPEPGFSSFVGMKPLAARHGLTIGELAHLLAGEFQADCAVEIVAMRHWSREMLFEATGAPWVMPSPNMPTRDTALVYPGMCLLEGTNLSEGRGTTRPFELFGAPYVDSRGLVDALQDYGLPGVRFRPAWFQPTFQKHAGRLCGGAQIHVTDTACFQPFRTAVAILHAVR